MTFNSEVVEEKHADISLCITDILVDGRPLEQMSDKKKKGDNSFTSDFTDRLVIPASYSHFTICFASLTYNRPSKINMRTGCKALMLIGIMWTLPAGLPIIPNCLQGVRVSATGNE